MRVKVIAQSYRSLKNLIESKLSGERLKDKVFRGGAWLGVGSAAEQAFRFGRSMILARLLVPSAFGLMAIVGSTASVLHTITDIGVKEGLIQHSRGEEDDYASAAWWLAFGRSLSLYVLFFSLAPLVARIYKNPELTLLMRVATISVIFDGIYSCRAYVALKKMNFSKWTMINSGGGICGIIVTLVLSLLLRDVWALVIGSVSEGAFRCLFSYIFFPYVPSLRWNRQAIRDLLGFSKGLFGLSFLNLAFARTDVFVLGKVFSAAELGIYTMGIYLVQTPGICFCVFFRPFAADHSARRAIRRGCDTADGRHSGLPHQPDERSDHHSLLFHRLAAAASQLCFVDVYPGDWFDLPAGHMVGPRRRPGCVSRRGCNRIFVPGASRRKRDRARSRTILEVVSDPSRNIPGHGRNLLRHEFYSRPGASVSKHRSGSRDIPGHLRIQPGLRPSKGAKRIRARCEPGHNPVLKS